MVQICHVLVRYAWKAMCVPSGDHDGCLASMEMSVIGLATPPAAGSVHNVPRRSMAMVRRSGDSAAAIDVPSCSVTCTLRASCSCAVIVNAHATSTMAMTRSLRMRVV